MYNADFGALSREERQRRQQLSPEARRAVRQGDAGQRRADRSTAQAATRERNLKFAAIRNERDPDCVYGKPGGGRSVSFGSGAGGYYGSRLQLA